MRVKDGEWLYPFMASGVGVPGSLKVKEFKGNELEGMMEAERVEKFAQT